MPIVSKPPVRVIGLGSLFRGDDAFGPRVVETLRAGWAFPAGVVLTDAGTPGLDLMVLLSDCRHAVLVDAVKGGGEPGQVRRFSRGEAIGPSPTARLSAHSLDLRETLLLLETTGQAPESVTLVGVEPQRVEAGIGLTPPVGDAVPEAAKAVVDRLVEIGFPPTRRTGLR